MIPATSDSRLCHVLYVEDNAGDARLLTEALNHSGFGFHVTVLRDGEEAVAYFDKRKPKPDIVVLDLELPKVHGIEVLREIKADPDLKAVRILVFADSRTPHREEIKPAGVDLLLPKPLLLDGYEQIVQAIHRLCCAS